MPNWVFNTLVIYGDSEKRKAVEAVLGADNELSRYAYEVSSQRNRETAEKFGREYDTVPYKVSALDFHNLVSPPKEAWEEYVGMSGVGDSPPMMSEHNWYSWRINNWNVKWNAVEANAEHEADNTTYRFDTAWDRIGEQLLTALAELLSQHGVTNATLRYEEEQGWGGELSWDLDLDDNYFRATDEWDIPNSHADYELRDSVCMCVLYEDDPDMWFADCPKVGG